MSCQHDSRAHDEQKPLHGALQGSVHQAFLSNDAGRMLLCLGDNLFGSNGVSGPQTRIASKAGVRPAPSPLGSDIKMVVGKVRRGVLPGGMARRCPECDAKHHGVQENCQICGFNFEAGFFEDAAKVDLRWIMANVKFRGANGARTVAVPLLEGCDSPASRCSTPTSSITASPIAQEERESAAAPPMLMPAQTIVKPVCQKQLKFCEATVAG